MNKLEVKIILMANKPISPIQIHRELIAFNSGMSYNWICRVCSDLKDKGHLIKSSTKGSIIRKRGAGCHKVYYTSTPEAISLANETLNKLAQKGDIL